LPLGKAFCYFPPNRQGDYCLVQAWTNSDASEIKVCLSCNNSLVGVVSPCVVENEGNLEKLDAACLNFLGEEAEALKSYLELIYKVKIKTRWES
jgi:hypothetical protein